MKKNMENCKLYKAFGRYYLLINNSIYEIPEENSTNKETALIWLTNFLLNASEIDKEINYVSSWIVRVLTAGLVPPKED